MYINVYIYKCERVCVYGKRYNGKVEELEKL